jgi:hypothetical protein
MRSQKTVEGAYQINMDMFEAAVGNGDGSWRKVNVV